jgi:membrane protein implicated in regulation of membrane protease activity
MFALADLFVISDTLDAVLLGSFFFGLVFVVLSLFLGMAHFGIGHDHGAFHPAHHGDAGHDIEKVSQVNIGSILAFLTWFGGVTYLLRNAIGMNAVLSILIGIGAGLAAGTVIVRFMRMLKSQEVFLDARQEQLVGSIARVTSPVRADGTGEITYELNGVRQVSAARAPAGIALPRGSEVVVLRRERGIAMVEPWVEETDAAAWERRFAAEPGRQKEALPQAKH